MLSASFCELAVKFSNRKDADTQKEICFLASFFKVKTVCAFQDCKYGKHMQHLTINLLSYYSTSIIYCRFLLVPIVEEGGFKVVPGFERSLLADQSAIVRLDS